MQIRSSNRFERRTIFLLQEYYGTTILEQCLFRSMFGMLLVKQLVKCKDGISLEDRMHIVRLD